MILCSFFWPLVISKQFLQFRLSSTISSRFSSTILLFISSGSRTIVDCFTFNTLFEQYLIVHADPYYLPSYIHNSPNSPLNTNHRNSFLRNGPGDLYWKFTPCLYIMFFFLINHFLATSCSGAKMKKNTLKPPPRIQSWQGFLGLAWDCLVAYQNRLTHSRHLTGAEESAGWRSELPSILFSFSYDFPVQSWRNHGETNHWNHHLVSDIKSSYLHLPGSCAISQISWVGGVDLPIHRSLLLDIFSGLRWLRVGGDVFQLEAAVIARIRTWTTAPRRTRDRTRPTKPKGAKFGDFFLPTDSFHPLIMSNHQFFTLFQWYFLMFFEKSLQSKEALPSFFFSRFHEFRRQSIWHLNLLK